MYQGSNTHMHGAGLLQGLLHAYILYRYLHAELAYIAKINWKASNTSLILLVYHVLYVLIRS